MYLFVTFTNISEMTPIIFLLVQFSKKSKEQTMFSMMCITYMQIFNPIYRIFTEQLANNHMHVFNM